MLHSVAHRGEGQGQGKFRNESLEQIIDGNV